MNTPQNMPEEEFDVIKLAEVVVPDKHLVSCLREAANGPIKDQELAYLHHHVTALSAVPPEHLWGTPSENEKQTSAAIMQLAAESTADLKTEEQQTGRPVLRDSITMVLEVIHSAGNPYVFNTEHDRWLFSPAGAPIRLKETLAEGTDRWATHAQTIQQPVAQKQWEHNENTVLTGYADKWGNTSNLAVAAIGDCMPYLVDPNIIESFEKAHSWADSMDSQKWPQELAGWSQTGWDIAERTADAATMTMEWATAQRCTQIFLGDDAEKVEEAALSVIVSIAQTMSCLKRWAMYAPQPPDNPSPSDCSYWLYKPSPIDFWSACLTSALIQYGYTDNGPEGAADLLLNR